MTRRAWLSGIALALLALTALVCAVGALVPGIAHDVASRAALDVVGLVCVAAVGFVAYDMAQNLTERR